VKIQLFQYKITEQINVWQLAIKPALETTIL